MVRRCVALTTKYERCKLPQLSDKSVYCCIHDNIYRNNPEELIKEKPFITRCNYNKIYDNKQRRTRLCYNMVVGGEFYCHRHTH